MKKEYNVIWIDDEWEKQQEFKDECEDLGIHLQGFSYQKAGMDELDKHPNLWDAVILDGEIKDKSDHEKPSTKGLLNALMHLASLPANRQIPRFISTGKDKVKENEMLKDEVIYIKDIDDEKLIDDIRATIDNIERFKVKKLYGDKIEALTSLINQDICEDVLTILCAIHFPSSTSDFIPRLFYNPLRKGLECIFRAANRVGIIPDAFIASGVVNLNQCFMYLIGKDADKIGFRYGNQGERIAPIYIQNMMSLILNLGNVNSHSQLTETELQAIDNRILKEGLSSKYLVFSMTLQLCEIASWMNRYISEHPDKDENLKMCIPLEIDEQEGKKEALDDSELVGLLEEHEGIFHMGEKFSVLLKHKELLGNKIRIINYVANTNIKTKQYPYFVREQDFELIEESENGSM